MSNPQPHLENLQPVRTTEEAREKGRAGGIASGEARKKRRALKEVAEALLGHEIDNEDLKDRLKKHGLEEITNQAIMVYSLFETACSPINKNQVSAFQELKKLVGEDTPQNVNVNINPPLADQAQRITAVLDEYAKQYKSDE